MPVFTKKRIVTVLNPEAWKSKSLQNRVNIACVNLPCSRRNILDEISFALIDPKVKIVHENGRPYDIPEDVDAIFGDDFDMRWYSMFLEQNKNKDGPKRYTRCYKRLELLYIMVMVRYPSVGRHLNR